MARFLSIAGACACLMALVSCSQAGKAASSGSPGAPDISVFAATTAAFHQTLRDNDLPRFMSYVERSAVIAPPGEPVLRGKDKIEKWYKDFLANYRTASLRLSNKENFVGAQWAVEFGHFDWRLQPTNGAQRSSIMEPICRCGNAKLTAVGALLERYGTARPKWL